MRAPEFLEDHRLAVVGWADQQQVGYALLDWEHINLTGGYLCRSSDKASVDKFRPLRPLQPA